MSESLKAFQKPTLLSETPLYTKAVEKSGLLPPELLLVVGVDGWAKIMNAHPRRMLRHKALVQCARLSFGLAGIYEPDAAMRIRQSKRQTARLKDVSGKEEIMQKIRKQNG